MRYIFPILFFISASCSFTPLHKETSRNYNILSQVKVRKLQAEQSHLLKNYLLEELNPNRVHSKERFVLDISVTKSVDDLLVQKDTTVSRSEMTVTAYYTLKDTSNKTIKQSHIKSVTSFEQNLSSYSSFTQEREAYKNALKDIARSLKSRIIVALMNKNLIVDENISK